MGIRIKVVWKAEKRRRSWITGKRSLRFERREILLTIRFQPTLKSSWNWSRSDRRTRKSSGDCHLGTPCTSLAWVNRQLKKMILTDMEDRYLNWAMTALKILVLWGKDHSKKGQAWVETRFHRLNHWSSYHIPSILSGRFVGNSKSLWVQLRGL